MYFPCMSVRMLPRENKGPDKPDLSLLLMEELEI